MANTALDLPPPGAAPDWTIDQDWGRYTKAEHERWDRLFERQWDLLQERADPAFLKGLKALDLHQGGIPAFEAINTELMDITGWRVVAVPGLVPDAIFFDHLANRRFPAGNFLRSEAEFDDIEAPDIFHDVFGHVPLLTDPVFADYMQAYGQGGLRALSLDRLTELARLYWYTVEFGLIETSNGLRIYGAGILSSPAECQYALEDQRPNRLRFDLRRLLQSRYRIDSLQETYFVIRSFRDLFEATQQDFGPIYDSLPRHQGFAANEVLSADELVVLASADCIK